MNRGRTLRAGAVLVALAVVLTIGFATTAYGADFNEGCTSCHGTEAQWEVGPVDRATACSKCHTPGLLGTHPYHNPGSNCGAVCHPGWGSSGYFAIPSWRGTQGSFASPASPDLAPATLHVIHSNARWLANIETADSKCASCHSVASCGACHEDAPSAGHSVHSSLGNGSYAARSPWSGVMGSGVIGEDQSVDSSAEQTNQCATAGCHNIAGSQSRTPSGREDNAAGVVKNPPLNWSVRYAGNYTAGRVIWSNKPGSTITFTFTGQQLELVSDKDPYRGKVGITLDGGAEQIVDLYSSTSVFQQLVYRTDLLADASHTVTIRVTGLKNPASRGTFVFVDQFRVFAAMPASIAPKCVSCHADKESGHGFSHEASLTAGAYKGNTCDKCHDLTLTSEHRRTSSATAPASCTACHTTSADYTLDTYNYTCGQAGGAGGPTCHQGAAAPHLAEDSSHAVTPVTETADCIACHGANLGVIHDDTNAARPQHASLTGGGSNGEAYSTSCLTCHSATSFPTTKDCTSAACHAASGVVSMATHPAPDHDAQPALAEAPRTGGKACSTCHAINGGTGRVELVGEHGKTSSVKGGSAAIGCMDCHGAAYFPTDWLGENNTCVACHPLAGGEAGEPHEAAEFTSKHDFSGYGTNASCAGIFCHSITQADIIHDVSMPGNGDCTSCHTAAVRQSGVPTVRTCSTCHPTSHDMSKHITTASEPCVRCHESADVRTLHGTCNVCHSNSEYPGITQGITADCVNCHKAGGVGDKSYTPYKPNHASGDEAAHLASGDIDGDYSALADCSLCHAKTMGAAHEGPTDIDFNLGAYADKCVACHELKVDTLAVKPWNRNCSACHATMHGNVFGAHNASSVPLSTNTSVTIGEACGAVGCHQSLVGWVMGGHACTRCHKDPTTKPTLNCGDCHTDKFGPHEKHDLDVPSSDYDNGTQAGCTNSGTGCHGTDSAAKFGAEYHPATGCTGGKCHASPTYASTNFATPPNCQECHDGTYVNAPNVATLAQAGAGGHYNETTHTAGTLTDEVEGASGGTVKGRCSDCHKSVNAAGIDGLYFQHQGLQSLGNTTCSECHNKNAAIATLVKDAVRDDDCEDCHESGVLPTMVMHDSGTAPVVAGSPVGGCGAGANGCHPNTNLHELHKGKAGGAVDTCAEAGCHDYNKQGWKPTGTTCGTGGACHTSDPHDPLAHNSSSSAACLRCHEAAGGVPTVDIRSIVYSNGYGATLAHPTCGTCHNTGLNLGLNNAPECVACHNNNGGDSSKIGKANYDPYTSNHYAVGAHDSSSTTGASYGNGNGQALTDYHGTAVTWNRQCTTCHTIDLRTEHEKSSISTATMAAYNDVCVGCHELKTDGLSGRWAGSCAGEGTSCHNMGNGSLHNNWTAKHDASSQQIASPGVSFSRGGQTPTGVDSQTFGTGTTWPIWSRSSTTYVVVSSTPPAGRSGSAAYLTRGSTIAGNQNMSESYNLSAYSTASVSFWYTTQGLSTGDYAAFEYSTNGSTWTPLVANQTANVGWTQVNGTLPISATTSVRMLLYGNTTSTERLYVDDIVVTGSAASAATYGAALPANSRADVSCGNPSGNVNPQSECHDVSDVADIHSSIVGRSDNGCPICHNGTSQNPTTVNCQSAQCHSATGVGLANNQEHDTDWHESQISSTAVFGTGFSATWCQGCHDNSIDNEHTVLTAYGDQPCSMCHKKSSNSAVPAVTAANTAAAIHGDATPGNALCTDCHTSSNQTAVHSQRVGDGGTPGTQFSPTWSGHRIFDPMPGVRTEFGTVAGVANVTWNAPTATTYLKIDAFGKDWRSNTAMVVCSDCHGSVTGATGPHGAAMTVNYAIRTGTTPYDNTYTTGSLYNNNGTMSNTTNLCSKCHNNSVQSYAGEAHSNGNHQGSPDGKCINCHVKIPHAWKRPRLIGYVTDPAPYASLEMQRIRVADPISSSTWSTKSNCQAACAGDHSSATSPYWP